MVKKTTVIKTKDTSEQIFSQIRQLVKNQVLIGIPAENAGRDPEEGEEKTPLSNAEIGYLMEKGSPPNNIPARPFLVPGIQEGKDAIAQQMKRGAMKAFKNDTNAADIALNAAGLAGMNAVQAKIEMGPFKILSDVTLARRKAKGRTGEKPLIDTGQLRRSITYVVRPKGET